MAGEIGNPQVAFRGLATGLDSASIIDALVSVRRVRQTKVQAQIAKLNKQQGAYGALRSKLSALRTKADAINTATKLGSATASSSDEAKATATASGGAAEGSYAVNVTSLARASAHNTAGFADKNSTIVGSGLLVINVGVDPYEINLASDATLEDIKTAINASNAPVTASIIDDGTPGAGFRLVLTSDQTGTAAAATIDDSGFVPAGQALGFTSIATGQDAVFSVNGLTVTRATNVVSDVLSGVTLTLKDPGATTVSVARNLDDVKKKIGEFVSAYNDVVSEVRVHRNYADREGKASLYGDSNLDRILSRLQSKLGETVAGLSADANAFADLGFTFGADGKIATDAEALSNAVESNYDGVVALFTQLGTGGGAGLARSVSTAVGEVITQMVLPKTASLSGRASSLNKRVGALETQLEKYAEQLRKRYAALETFAGRFQSAGATLNALGS